MRAENTFRESGVSNLKEVLPSTMAGYSYLNSSFGHHIQHSYGKKNTTIQRIGFFLLSHIIPSLRFAIVTRSVPICSKDNCSLRENVVSYHLQLSQNEKNPAGTHRRVHQGMKVPSGEGACLTHGGNNAELLQHAEVIEVVPLFGNLAVRDA